MSRLKTAAYFVGMAVATAIITFIIANDITVGNFQSKFATMFARASVTSADRSPVTPAPVTTTYDETTLAASEICGKMADRIGRTLLRFDLFQGFRPQGSTDESLGLKETDTFVCVFTSGETIPFMATFVGGRIVSIQ